MELNQEFIDSLVVDEEKIIKKIAEELNIKNEQVSVVTGLFAEGSTIPFIARYRKEQTGSLDEVQIINIDSSYKSLSNLEKRRLEIIKGIFSQGKLTESLFENIQGALTLAELEDIYSPYKRKKKTRGMIAVEKGLTPLAEAMKELETKALEKMALNFIVLPDDPKIAETPELNRVNNNKFIDYILEMNDGIKLVLDIQKLIFDHDVAY